MRAADEIDTIHVAKLKELEIPKGYFSHASNVTLLPNSHPAPRGEIDHPSTLSTKRQAHAIT